MRIKIRPVPIFLLCFVLFGKIHLNAQAIITGRVTDSLGKPLSPATISLLKKRNGLVLAFAITDSKGSYQLKITSAGVKDSLIVQATMLGYATCDTTVSQAEQIADFRLNTYDISLPELTIKSNKLIVKLEGDTINYDVSAFISPQDRVIGDIIKKLPGIEVDVNGKITYNGKNINRFYINGENLLDGKYNIATNGIPGDVVEKIQVLENHQPIKSLKNIVPSGDPAMNIVLKEKARIKPIGQGDVAAGTAESYSGLVNIMLFLKKLQFINYIKVNNTGIDLSSDLISHFEGGQDNIPSPFMSIGISNPPLKKSRYLFNNSSLVNINNLLKLGNDLQLRINASYLTDKQYQFSGSSVNYFLPSDTIHYEENQQSRIYENKLNTRFTLTANKTGYYLNNVMIIENSAKQTWGSLLATGTGNIDQMLSGTISNISNELTYTKLDKRKNSVLEGHAYINLVRNPATLQVMPGKNEAVFNNGNPYAALIQDAVIPTLYTNNYLSYKISGKIRQSYKAGFSYQDQDLNTTLQSVQLNGAKAIVEDSFVNRFHWQQLKMYAQGDYSLVSSKMELTLSIPVNYIRTKYGETSQPNQLSVLPLTPMLYFKYNTGKENYFTTRYTYENNWGDIKNVFDGYIMQTYRSFMANSAFLPETRIHNIGGGFFFKNTLKIFFFNINAGYMVSAANSIASTTFNSVLQLSKNIPVLNTTEMKVINGSLSKYIFRLKTTIGVKIAWQQSTNNQLLNSVLLKYRNSQFVIGATLNSKLSSWASMGYKNSFSRFSNRPDGDGHTDSRGTQEVFTSQHQGDLNFSFSQNLLLKFSGDYYYNHIQNVNRTSAFFADATCTYKWNKLKTDIEISINNISGTDEYTNVSALSNAVMSYTYRIRPRMLLVKLLFRF